MRKKQTKQKTVKTKKKKSTPKAKISIKDVFVLLARKDFRSFMQACFAELHPGKEFLDNWHIDAICEQIILALKGKRRRLIVNLPPRYLKSFLFSVVLPAWILGQNPGARIITVSYGDELTKKFMREFRTIIKSKWYQKLFPRTKIGNKDTENEITTTKNGFRLSTSIGGTLTGRGADIIIIDDPLKADDAWSESRRQTVNDWYDNTLYSRLDDKKNGICIIVMQRLHEDDLTGHLSEKGGFHILSLPAIAEEQQSILIRDNTTFTRQVGTALHEEREDLETLEGIRQTIGSTNFAAQYQQSPLPADGNLFKRAWIKYCDAPDPENDGIFVWSWDTASSIKDSADYSVGTYWYMIGEKRYLLHAVRVKKEFVDLKNFVEACAREKRSDVLLVEKAGMGEALIQVFYQTRSDVIGIEPKGSKEARVMAQAVPFELSHIYFPRQDTPWMSWFMKELLIFPSGKNDDAVDSLTQALNWAYGKRFDPIKRAIRGERPLGSGRRINRNRSEYVGSLSNLSRSFGGGLF